MTESIYTEDLKATLSSFFKDSDIRKITYMPYDSVKISIERTDKITNSFRYVNQDLSNSKKSRYIYGSLVDFINNLSDVIKGSNKTFARRDHTKPACIEIHRFYNVKPKTYVSRPGGLEFTLNHSNTSSP